MGIMTPNSFVPHPVTKFENSMTYMQRCFNALIYVYEAAVRRFSYIPAQNNLAKKYFRSGINGELPHIQVVINKISLVLSNTYRMSQNRPQMASQVNIAGLHLTDDSNLPPELKVGNTNTPKNKTFMKFFNFQGNPFEFPTQNDLRLIRIVFKAIANA